MTDVMPVPFIIMASGRGSNAIAILEAFSSEPASRLGKSVALVCDRAGAPVLERVKKFGIPTFLVEKRTGEDRGAHEKRILEALSQIKFEAIVLAGYMRILSSGFVERFRNRMINIHPSLLPAYPGVNAYEQAWKAQVAKTGVTVHLVEHEVDSGPILAQEDFAIEPGMTLAEVEERGLALEHRLYPRVLQDWFQDLNKKEKLHVR